MSSKDPSGPVKDSPAAPPKPGRPGRGGRRHPLARFLFRRVVTALLLALGITLVTFVLTNLVPGDPVAANLGQRALGDPAIVAQWRAEHGLDKPLPQQYLLHLQGVLQGDFGMSQQSHRPVADDLAEAVPATLELAGTAILISVVLGVAFGVVAALRRDRLSDHVLRVVSLVGISVPTFWLALIAFYVFFYRLQITPGSGRIDPGMSPPPTVTGLYTVDAALAGQWDVFSSALGHLLTPALVLALYTIGLLTRFTRSAVLEVLGQDYVRAARAKGLPPRVILFRYVLRSALVPVITVAGLAFGSLLSGTVLVEAIFAWPGVGQYAYKSATSLDLPAVMGVGLVVGCVYLVINLIVDVLYGIIDPRVRMS
ncbi:peptide/nickel transport system permease protein [Streptosporangium becharense]|uniref:Peptide/nickel transport system permease protein n=1 Tax=Streptosporangium becharense TaxID=1816182 RepID=A0A7W9IMJ7_9ACTN|nr:ABC transporter permease [Streptosporangium becharense]MBB2910328.1 peptide/nickel transport system permease protein [Streptosporangium becharense]MBB5823071.1 peptide/nickel transport system permease protein [Streptosporangium becharense]